MSDTDTLDEDPRPLLQLASTPEVLHEALTLLDADAPAPLARARHDALFRAAVDRVHGRRPAPRLVQALAFATACLLGAVLTFGVFERLMAPSLTAAPGAVYTLDGRTLTIVSGHVEVAARRPLTVRAGGYELFVQNARVAFDVTAQGAVVLVERGEVVQRDADGRRVLRAGDRLEPAAPLELPAAHSEACAPGADGCLTALAEGSGLEAETALYELGLSAHERGDAAAALARFTEHQRRFPDGVLAPEASIGVMLSHTALKNRAAAAVEARRFVERFPEDPRVARVRSLAR